MLVFYFLSLYHGKKFESMSAKRENISKTTVSLCRGNLEANVAEEMVVIHASWMEHPHDHVYVRPPDFPYWILGYSVSGVARVTCNGMTWLVPEGCVNLTPPQEIYSVEYAGSGEPWIGAWFAFLPIKRLEHLLTLPRHMSYRMGGDVSDTCYHASIRAAFREAAQWQANQWLHWKDFVLNAAERVLLLTHAALSDAARSHDPRIIEVCDMMRSRLEDSHTVASLARKVHLSPTHFAECFRKEMGVTPMRWLEWRRIAQAQEWLISTSLSVQEIARRVGFENQFHFSTRFRARVGQSPRQYRHAPLSSPGEY